jgi:hypothetical protein
MPRTRRIWIDAFYSIGVAATLACIALILASNTDLFWRFEHRRFPLSWGLASVAMLAFLAAEICHFLVLLPGRVEDRSPEPSLEWEFETVE